MVPDDRVQRELMQAIRSDALPDDARARAGHLLDLLDEPLRISLLGKPASGKSTILNLLVGADVLPPDMRLPTVALRFAEAAQTTCTLANGTKTTIAGADLAQVTALAPVFVDIQMPLPALGKISLLDIATPDDQTALHRASQWAAKRSDVVLWCSQSFDTAELAVWSQMPQLIRDHSFLMITKADDLRAKGLLETVMAQAEILAEDDFHQIIPISATRAIAARQADGTIDKDRMRESGGMALISAILKQVALRKQAVADMADVLLAQHPGALQSAPPKTAPPTPRQPQAMTPGAHEVCQKAVDQLRAQGEILSALLRAPADDTDAVIMAQTVDQLHWLSDFLNDNGDKTDPVLDRAREMAFDAADLVQLMQMEKRGSALVDAVSLMLQIRRELEAELAA